MEIKITTRRGHTFTTTTEMLKKIGRENLLTFFCRRESHREILKNGFHPTEQEITTMAERLKLAEQFARIQGGCGYRGMEMRVFNDHRISEGMARRLTEIQGVDVSDIDFKKLAVEDMRRSFEFECRLANVNPEQYFNLDMQTEKQDTPGKIKRAIELLAGTKSAFKSEAVQEAREILESIIK